MIQTTRLDNGITILSEHIPYVQSVAMGIWYGVGSREEDNRIHGISHVIEHMMFKGTERRNAYQIALEIDFVGGVLNAFTDKEHTCYYARVLGEHLPVAADVLTDITMNSLYDAEELDREKGVILEEIKRYEDSPDELVHDLFVQNLFSNHPIGRSVIGTPATVSALKREDIVEYTRRFYRPNRCYVVTAGCAKHEDVVRLFEKTLGTAEGSTTPMVTSDVKATNGEFRVERPTEQVHFCLGSSGPSHYDDDKYPLAVMDAALGSGMSSRLFQEVRERRGLAYSIGSYPHSYREGGFFAIYAGTSPDKLDEVLSVCRKECDDVRVNGIREDELNRAKNQIKGGLLLSLESMSNRMTRLAKSQLYFDRVIPIEEIVGKVEAVTNDDIIRVAGRVLDPDVMNLTMIGPEHKNGSTNA